MFLRQSLAANLQRLTEPIRFLTEHVDAMFINSFERETLRNSIAFREFVKGVIKSRRNEMMTPGYVRKGDFLTMLLEDELFKHQEEYMVDECLSFMLAGTQTTTLLITNATYNLAKKDKSRH